MYKFIYKYVSIIYGYLRTHVRRAYNYVYISLIIFSTV